LDVWAIGTSISERAVKIHGPSCQSAANAERCSGNSQAMREALVGSVLARALQMS